MEPLLPKGLASLDKSSRARKTEYLIQRPKRPYTPSRTISGFTTAPFASHSHRPRRFPTTRLQSLLSRLAFADPSESDAHSLRHIPLRDHADAQR